MSFRAALRNRGFRSLWVAQAVSRLGDSVHEIALIWLVFEVTGDPVLMSAVAVASLLPNLLVSLPAGAVVDAVSRRSVLVGTQLVRGIAVLAIPLVGSRGPLAPTVLAVALVAGTMEAFATPARGALIPALVPESDLDAANSLTGMTRSASRTLYVLGGAVVGVVGSYAAFYVDSATFLVAAGVLLVGVPRDAPGEAGPRGPIRPRGVIEDARDGVRFIRRSSVLPSVVLLSVLTGFALGPLSIVLPLFVESVLGRGSVAFGVLYGCIFVGALVGGALVGGMDDRLASRRGRVVILGVVLVGGALALAAVVPPLVPFPYPLSAGLFALAGGAITLIRVPLRTVVQSAVPDRSRGRVFSIMGVAGLAAPPLSIALAGPLVEWLGVSTVLLGEGLLVIAAGAVLSLTPIAAIEDVQRLEEALSGLDPD